MSVDHLTWMPNEPARQISGGLQIANCKLSILDCQFATQVGSMRVYDFVFAADPIRWRESE